MQPSSWILEAIFIIKYRELYLEYESCKHCSCELKNVKSVIRMSDYNSFESRRRSRKGGSNSRAYLATLRKRYPRSRG